MLTKPRAAQRMHACVLGLLSGRRLEPLPKEVQLASCERACWQQVAADLGGRNRGEEPKSLRPGIARVSPGYVSGIAREGAVFATLFGKGFV